MPRKLTAKQEAFALRYLENGHNASEAYRAAFSAKSMSQAAIANEAYKLLKRPDIALMVEENRAKLREDHEVTIQTVTDMLKEDRDLARNLDQAGSAVSAAMGLAKLHGLIVDKSVVKVTSHEEKLRELEAAIIPSDDDEEHQTVQ